MGRRGKAMDLFICNSISIMSEKALAAWRSLGMVLCEVVF